MKWNMISTGDIALRKGGSVDPKKHQDEVFELYSIPAFDAGAPEVVAGSAIGSSKKAVQPNDVMISRIVPHIRRACVVGPAKGHRQIASGEWIIFRDERIWPKYLRWQLVGDVFHSAFMRTVSGVGGSLLRARPAEVFKVEIPLPPLAEQKRIARILDAADALRAKRREALAQLDTLIQSTFLDMFGDPVTNPIEWEVRSLGDLAVKKPNNGVFRRNHEYSESLDSGLPVVWVVELFRGNRIDVSESRRLEATQTEIEKYGLLPGDLLFCRSSLKLDGIAYNNVFLGEPEEALFECHLIRVSPKTDVVNPIFLNLQLRSVPMRALLKSKSKTATMTTIDQQALSSVEVVVPPGSLQSRFAAIGESVEHQKASQRAHLDELDTLFASLQSRAFRGDL